MNKTLVADVYKLYGTASMSIPADSPLEEVIGTINAANNWWGTTNIKEIEARIQDKKDDPSLGKVVFQPFLEESVEIGGVVSIQ